jgi:hypothetical protein
MDIDDDGTQRAAVADNFGVEPDFEELDEEAKEVSIAYGRSGNGRLMNRTGLRKSVVNSRRRLLE